MSSADVATRYLEAPGPGGGQRRSHAGHPGAPGLNAPVYCHPAEQAAAEPSSAYRDYWDRPKLDPHGRTALWRLIATWDGGAELARAADAPS